VSDGLIALAPGRAGELIRLLRGASRDLEDAADGSRVLLLEVSRSTAAAGLLEDVAAWSRRLARELTERLERIAALEQEPLAVVRDGRLVHLYLDVRDADVVDDVVGMLVDTGVLGGCVPGGDPAARHAALDRLPKSLVRALTAQVPRLLGSADGVPFRIRDAANRRLLAHELRRLSAHRGRIAAGLRDEMARLGFPDSDPRSTPELHRLLLAARVDGRTWVALTAQHRRLQENDALHRQLAGWRDDPALRVLKLDVAGGRAIVARGDPDTATHVATIIPGANTTLLGLGGAYAGWMDRLHRVSQDRVQLEGPGAASTILWLDLDAPQGLVPAAMGTGPADDAADRLASFLAGVGAVDRTLVTTIGHSYGSVVLGRTLAAHPGAVESDQLVALGSPGMGVQRGRQLGLRADQRLYASTLPGDPIAAVGTWNPVTGDLGRVVHGPDPRRLGATETISLPVHDLPVEGGRIRRGVDRHMQYLDEGSVGLGTFADLVAGRHRFGPRRTGR
jgi:hypothetical protein